MFNRFQSTPLIKLVWLCLMLAIAPLLVACGATTKPIVVKETQTVVLAPPAKFTAPTPVPALGYTKEEWDAADWAGRSQFNSIQVVKVYQALDMCNRDKNSITDWLTKEKANAEKNNPK